MIPSIEEISDNIRALHHFDSAVWHGGNVVEVIRLYGRFFVFADWRMGDGFEYDDSGDYPADIRRLSVTVQNLLGGKDS